jgi:hypothetical protein
MHPAVCHAEDIQWDSLHNNNFEKDKIDTTVSTFALLAVGGNATCFDPFLGSSSVSILSLYGSILNDNAIQELVPIFLFA